MRNRKKSRTYVSVMKDYLFDFTLKLSNSIDIIGIPMIRNAIKSSINALFYSQYVYPKKINITQKSDMNDYDDNDSDYELGDEYNNNNNGDDDFVFLPRNNQRSKIQKKMAISKIALIYPDDETLPPDFELIDRSCSNSCASNIHSGTSLSPVYFCVQKIAENGDLENEDDINNDDYEEKSFISDLFLIPKLLIDTLPENDDLEIVQSISGCCDNLIFYDNNGDESYLILDRSSKEIYIDDLKIGFANELAYVHDLKEKALQQQNYNLFPVNYSHLKIRSSSASRNNNADNNPNADIYLFYRRISHSNSNSINQQTRNTVPDRSYIPAQLNSNLRNNHHMKNDNFSSRDNINNSRKPSVRSSFSSIKNSISSEIKSHKSKKLIGFYFYSFSFI